MGLFILTAVAAVAVWAYLELLPEWRDYQARMQFEREASQLKAGPEQSLADLFQVGSYVALNDFDASGARVDIVSAPVIFKRYWYCLYFVQSDDSPESGSGRVFPNPKRIWAEVRVYRIPHAPAGYQAQSARGRARQAELTAEGEESHPSTLNPVYMIDFYEVITGRETSDLGLDFELIHSDSAVASPLIPAGGTAGGRP